MGSSMQRRLIDCLVQTVGAHADELTELDRAVGDGDHGLNMQRGFAEVAAQVERLAALAPGEALQGIGRILLMKVGGASGPLYSTLFTALGKAWPTPFELPAFAAACGAAVDAVRRIGKSDSGQKTLLDVLVPVQRELALGGDGLARRLSACAQRSAAATVPMKAIRGRASYLGDRSIGHMDPGARSAALLIAALCEVWVSFGDDGADGSGNEGGKGHGNEIGSEGGGKQSG